jgi:hypothetical protein
MNLIVVVLPLIELCGAVGKPLKSCFRAVWMRAGFQPAVPRSDPESSNDATAELSDNCEQARDAERAEEAQEGDEMTVELQLSACGSGDVILEVPSSLPQRRHVTVARS